MKMVSKAFRREDGSLDPEDKEFAVHGAGLIRISSTVDATTGGAVGFSFGVSWGRHEYAGGVIDKSEAIRLAKHILRITNLDELGI